MPADVETMAWTNEVPWHGLGVQVDGSQSVKQMLKAAQLDWRVERRPMQAGVWVDGPGGKEDQRVAMFNPKTSVEVSEFSALVRDKDNKVFDVVGSQYVPVQNEQAFEFFNEFVKAGKATMETAGALRGGRWVWGLANLKASFKLSSNDVVKGYLLCLCPHEQGKSMLFKFTSVRVVCSNTMAMALSEKARPEFRRTHRSEFDAAAVEHAKEKLGIARDQLGDFEKVARKLVAKKVTQQTAIRVLAPIYASDIAVADLIKDFEKHGTTSLKKVIECVQLAPGATPGNAWGVLNGVTYYADHIASRSADKRLSNAWMGKTAIQKERVMEALLEL